MAWEQRGSRSYYYTAERIDGRVVKRYVGAGRVAELAAQLEAATSAQNAATAERQRGERGRHRRRGRQVHRPLRCHYLALARIAKRR